MPAAKLPHWNAAISPGTVRRCGRWRRPWVCALSRFEQIAIDKWEPVAQHIPPWVETVQGSINGYGVQGYVVHDGGEAILVDTAYNAPAMLETSATRVSLVGICLTHGHADHAEGIEQILANTKFRSILVLTIWASSVGGLERICWLCRVDGLSFRSGTGRFDVHDAGSYAGWNLLSCG